MDSRTVATRDHEIVSAVNRRTGAGLRVVGRAWHGRLGGAIYAEWPDGRPAVVTRFLGPFAEAERTVEVLAQVRARGLPVARHDLVVDHDHATGVVDWNLGASRGDRLFALIQTRIDREWFVRATDADPVETAAAVHLDEILAHRIAPATLRLYWAHWMLRQLTWAVRSTPPDVVDWHLDMIETRLA